MKRVKRRTFSGHVCEQEIYFVADTAATAGIPLKARKPRLRFKTEEERAAHRDGIARRAHARDINTNFGPCSLYSTLTFDDRHEVYSFVDAKRIRYNYIRRLKRAYPDAKIRAYLGRGETTARIHMHLITHGIPAAELVRLWGMGTVTRVEHLRETNYRNTDKSEVGRDYTALANYLFDHWTPEQGGHRYYKTRDGEMSKCDREDAAECKRIYTEKNPPTAPKAPDGWAYYLTEITITPYGYMNFKYAMLRTVTPTGRPRKFDPPKVLIHNLDRCL